MVAAVDGGIACGVFNLDNPAVVGAFDPDGTPTFSEVVVGAVAAIFRGSAATEVYRAVLAHRGTRAGSPGAFDEVHVASATRLRFVKAINGGRSAIMLVTKRSTSVGMAWVRLRSDVALMESLLRAAG